MTNTKSKKTSKSKPVESNPVESKPVENKKAHASKKQQPAKKEEVRVKFEVGQNVKRPSKNLCGIILSVNEDKDGFTNKATVSWENGMQYAISSKEIVAN